MTTSRRLYSANQKAQTKRLRLPHAALFRPAEQAHRDFRETRFRRILSWLRLRYEKHGERPCSLGEEMMRRLWIACAAIALGTLISLSLADAQQPPLATAEYSA